MSVEIVGPKGFEYQYLVTLWMALLFLEEDDEHVYVESEGFEDAFLSFQIEETHYIDIQVKNKNSDVTLEEFCGWLAHFKQRSTEDFLLNQLQQENHHVVFVTDNRCTDAVSVFLYGRKNRGISKKKIVSICNKILASIENKTGINERRYLTLKQYFDITPVDDLKYIFEKIYIIENQKPEVIEENICKRLKERYLIPEVICVDVLNQMMEVVRKGRDNKNDIIPDIKQIIAKRSMERILQEDSNYCIREEFQALRMKINKEHVLLLTGIPFSGKTILAKAIVQSFLEEGFHVKRAENLVHDNEAYNFLLSKENDSRILLLEDPFGHIKLNEDSLLEQDKLNILIRECVSENRKIVVTSRIDILLELYKKSELEQCCIYGHMWMNISIKSRSEAEMIWQKYYGTSGYRVFERLYSYFKEKNERLFLEIGEIGHLHTKIPEITLLDQMKCEEIVQCASISAEEVCKKIESYGEIHKNLIILLGCFCNTISAISEKDFVYILHSDNLKLSIRKNEEDFVSVSLGGEDDTVEIFPEYSEDYKLQLEEKKALRELCKKGYLYRDSITNQISFKHPLYHYASKLLLREELEWEVELLIEYLQKGIGSMARSGAICALNTLEEEFPLSQQIFDCFFDGSNSIFPAVRDCAILFLDRKFDVLNEKQQKEFFKNIGRNKTADKYLNWKEDECWYHLSNSYHFSFLEMWNNIYDDSSDIENICQKVTNCENISTKEIYQVLYSRLGAELPFEVLEYALLKEEAVIRSRAMYYVFSVYGAHLKDVQKTYLSRFENYNVVYEIVRGAIENWRNLSKETKNNIIEYIKMQLRRKSVAYYLKGLFENFGDKYKEDFIKWDDNSENDKKELWKLWAELFAQWLLCFPARYSSVNAPHMVYTAEKSIPYLVNEPEVIIVTNAWLKWLNEYMQFRSHDDFGMSVMNYLLKGTKDTPILREGILKNSLEEKDTNIVTSHLFHIVNNWKILSGEEKNAICDFLKSKRRLDYKWIQAVCIVQKNVPKEIQIAICEEEFLNKRTDEILNTLIQNGLLEECISIFCGFPQPLWWNGYHHQADYRKWDSILAEILKQGVFNQTYYIALREFIDALYNKEVHRFEDGYILYKEMIQNETARKWIFQRLAYELNVNQDCKEMWDDLLEASTDEEKKNYFKKISDFIEIVEFKNMGYGGLLTEFEEKDIRKYLLPNFSEDETIIKLCENMRWLYSGNILIKEVNVSFENDITLEVDKEAIEKLENVFKNVIIKVYQDMEVRLLLTDNIVKNTIKKLNINFPEFELILKQHKEDFWKRHENTEKEFQENCPLDINDHYELSNWYDTRSNY